MARRFKDARETRAYHWRSGAGNAVKLNVLHKGQDKVINLTLGQLPNTLEAKADTDNSDQGSATPRNRRAEARPDARAPPTACAGAGKDGVVRCDLTSIRRALRLSAVSRKVTSFWKLPERSSPMRETCATRSMPRAPTTRTAF